MEKEIKPSVYIAMPCYDSVKINTMLSVIKLVEQFRLSGVKMGINTMKSPLIHQARNYLTSVFLTTEYQYLLFIDSDVEFEPDAVFRMLVAKKDIICTPYRVKSEQLDKHIYTVEFKDPKNIPFLPGGLVELEAGPTGLMLIDRTVFEKIIKNHPDLKIKNKATPTADKSLEFYYNFFDFGFDNHYATGEDISFCNLAKENDFKIYANTESTTKHHGSWAWEGKFKESLNG
jgi:glycosyltransferase involved in cell wall biosynthesis